MKKTFLAAAAAATMLVSGAAQAVTFTYAAYNEAGSWQSLSYANNGSGTSTLQSINAPGAYVAFKFFDDASDGVTLPSSLTNYQDAIMTLTTSTTAQAEVSGPFVNQVFGEGSISFTAAPTSAFAGLNLVTITFSQLDLSGRLNQASAGTFSSTPDSIMTITSDFFNFSSVNASNFSLTMTAMLPALQLAANGQIASFTANSSGNFASDPAPVYVPEPAMLGLFGMGAVALGFARRRKK